MSIKMKLLTGAIVLVVAVILILNRRPQSIQPRTFASEEERRNGPCPGTIENVQTADQKTHRLIPNWYACHPVERGDLVYLRFSDRISPVARKVYGIPNDSFQLSFNEQHQGWEIKINGELLKDREKKTFVFGSKNPPLLSLYERSMKGILTAKSFIVFSETSPGDADSGSLGVVNVDDFIGKIETQSK